jgi:hypothetical protein
MTHKIIGSAGIMLATLLAFVQPALAQEGQAVHQTPFTNFNALDGKSENLTMGQDVLVGGNPIDDLLLLMNEDNIPVIMKDGEIYKNAR